jgi:type I restriction enzyme M protein
LPNGVFSPYTPIETNLLFFDRSGSTEQIWYYELPLPEGRKNYTKTQPIQFEDFSDCIAWWKNRKENDRAWKSSADQVLKYDGEHRLLSANLDMKNPNGRADFEHLPPAQLLDDIIAKERRVLEILAGIKESLETTL